jgi:hypothetical protein
MILMLAIALTLPGCGSQEPPASGTPAATSPPLRHKASATAKPSSGARVDVRSAKFQATWWTWATSREQINPVTDTTGAQCAKRQPDGVWLVAGSFGGKVHRRCTVPAGVPIAGPLINLASTDAGDCDGFVAAAKGTVSTDAAPVVTTVDTVRFEFVAERGNPAGFPAGRNKVFGCGIWFSAGPFAAGRQQLVLNGRHGSFSVEATYDLIITTTR